jgi:hypothetical protein
MPAKKKTADPERLGEQYREAKAGVIECRKREVEVDLERMAWLREHRGLPAHVLYDRKTGDPIHPELVKLEDALAKATRDTEWCQAVVLAAGELVKGEPLKKILARNAAHRDGA